MKKILLIALVAVFVGCQPSEKLDLTGDWKLTEMNGAKLENPEVEITLSFDTDQMQVNGNGGCNQYFGSYTLNNNELEFSNMGATKMACPDIDNIEMEYFQLLDGKLIAKSTDNRLELKKEDKTVLVFEK